MCLLKQWRRSGWEPRSLGISKRKWALEATGKGSFDFDFKRGGEGETCSQCTLGNVVRDQPVSYEGKEFRFKSRYPLPRDWLAGLSIKLHP